MRAAGCQKNLQQPAAKFSRELVSPACLDLVVKTEIPTYLLITRTPRLGRLSAKLHIKSRTFSKTLWVRLHEKGGKEHSVPCHHHLETYLQDHIEAAGLAGDREGPLFRTTVRRTKAMTERRMTQSDALAHAAAPRGSRYSDRGLQSHLPRHRHHRLSRQRWLAGKRPSHGRSRESPHH